MIPNQEQREITRIGNFTEQEMGLAEGSESFVFKVLRDAIYSDKIMAILREILTNALDEHIKYNIETKPVEITFPNTFAPELRIRDFAGGLTDEQVFHFFGKYGASDKRTSNKVVGMFGLGCKCPLAYSDAFSVVSHKDGIKSTFSIYIDETTVGKIAKLMESETTEPNGLEVIVPVKPLDIDKFQTKGFDLLKYVKTKPVIKGVTAPNLDRVEPPVSGPTWRYYGDARGTTIIQGQIGYPLDVSKMGMRYYESANVPAGYIANWEYDLLTSGLEIDVNIGDIEITASREALQMNEKTIAAIRAKLAQVRQEIQGLVEQKFQTAKTLFDARSLYFTFFQKGGSYGKTLHSAIGQVQWNGHIIDSNKLELSNKQHLMVYRKYRSRKMDNIKLDNYTHTFLACHDGLVLYYDDTDRKQNMYKRRAKTLLDKGVELVTFLQSDDLAELKTLGIDVSTLTKLSTVTPTVLTSTRVTNGPNASLRAKHQMNVFELDIPALKSGVSSVKSELWKVATITPNTQVYIPIERFSPIGMDFTSMYSIREIINALDTVGHPITFPIYGLKSKQDTGNMVKFDVWFKEFFTKTLNHLLAEVALIKDINHWECFHWFINESKLPKGIVQNYAKLYNIALGVSEYRNKYNSTAQKTVNAKRVLVANCGQKLSGDRPLITAGDKVKKAYPLLARFQNAQEQESYEAYLIDYIKLIDAR